MAEKEREIDYQFKIVIVGDTGVNKTTFLQRFVTEKSRGFSLPTFDVDFKVKIIEIDEEIIKLQIWDTPGRQLLRHLAQSCYQGAHGVMLVYDVANEKSFQNIGSWIKHIEEHTHGTAVQLMLIGNGIEKESKREVPAERAAQLANTYGMQFVEVNGNTGMNVSESFHLLARRIRSQLDVSEYVLDFWRKKKSTKIPEEIGQDPYARELYEKALKDGKERDRSIRVNIIGNFKQGKTSLLRRLLDEPIDGVESTNGIDIHKFECFRGSDEKLTYVKEDDDGSQRIVQRLARVALSGSEQETDSATAKTDESILSAKESEKQHNTDSQNLNQIGDTKPFISKSNFRSTNNESNYTVINSLDTKPKTERQKEARIAMLTMEQQRTFEKELSSKKVLDSKHNTFSFWDFGRQYVFYATHALFHSRKAIYILVFDLTTPLSETVIDDEYPSDHNEKSMAYYIMFWMNSIHSFVWSRDGNEPVVLLVGTHKDNISGNEETKSKYIQQYFSDVRNLFDGTEVLNHFYPTDFAVSNFVSNDPVISTLRNTIVEIGDNISSMVEIPAKWIQLEKSLNENKHMKIINFDRIQAIDFENEYPLGEIEQIKLFLQYHHERGTYLYFDESPISEYVILDPQFLIDAFKCIITSERFCTNEPAVRPLWKRLLSEARLEQDLVDRQWSKEDGLFIQHKMILLAFLTKHHILSEAQSYDEDSNSSSGLGWYIVPSLLREISSENEVAEFLKGRQRSELRFTMMFENSTIVPMIYNRLTAGLVGRWPILVAEMRNKPLVFRNLRIVRIAHDFAGVSEIKHDCVDLFLVKLCPSSVQNQRQQADRFRRFAESVVKHEFRKLQEVNERNVTPYTVNFRCNHESHGIRGSLNIIQKETITEHNYVPCPDLETHFSNMERTLSEWYDSPGPNAVMNCVLNDQILGRLSRCVGSNWQLLGLELGLTQIDIDHLIEDHPYSTAVKIFNMLRKWTSKMDGSATVVKLIQAMKQCPSVTIDWDEVRNFEEQLH